MKRIEIKDTVLIGSYSEVENLPLSSIVKNDTSGAMLNGLIIKGYETKFKDTKNTNYEVFETGCLDEFINNYFVKNKLNMPVNIQHDNSNLCGRVLIIEVNTIGFYFVVYVPKKYKHYEYLRDFLLKEGIIQGFSKHGWSEDYDCIYNSDGSFSHYLVKKMVIYGVSLVSIPANAVPFEAVKEIKIENSLTFENKVEQEKSKFSKMFN
jgi:hypothetical protein